MKILPDNLALFVGGGITADSVPEDEWLETEMKAETLLSILSRLTSRS
jgi:isochorismate synthase